MKVQEALKAAQKVICEGIYSEDGMDGDDGQKALLAIDAVLAEIEKCEPVAFMDEFGNIVSAKWEELYGDGTIYTRPLCHCGTSPISKEWVGLSDQQIQNLIINSDNYNKFQFIKSVEHTVKQINAPEKG